MRFFGRRPVSRRTLSALLLFAATTPVDSFSDLRLRSRRLVSVPLGGSWRWRRGNHRISIMMMKTNNSNNNNDDDDDNESSSVGGANEKSPLLGSSETAAPVETKSTGQQILDLAVPAAAALLIDPVMTLADTAFVGHYSSSADQLAGMGSAAALLTFSFYLFNFLCTATTPLVSSKRAAGAESEAVAVAGQALSLALTLGISLTVLLFNFKQPLLRLMGTSLTGDDANGYGLAFLSVRAFAAPAVFFIEASTGVLRGYLDTKTPVMVLILANLVNLALDVVLIAYAGLGPLGAAIATTSAEWISAGLFFSVLAGIIPSVDALMGRNGQADGNIADKNGDPWRPKIVPLLELPAWKEVQPLVVASSSLFFRALVLQLFLSAAAAMAARGGGSFSEGAAAAVAAHQIGIQLWLVCSFFCDSLAAASQGLVADALGRQNPRDVRDVAVTVFQYSAVLGLGLAGLLQAGGSTGLLYNLFTDNVSTRMALARILPLIVIAQPVNSLVFAADGVIQGASEFPFQARAMALSGLTGVATFVALDLGGSGTDTLEHVWQALLALQLMRGFTSLYKLVDSQGPIRLLEQA